MEFLALKALRGSIAKWKRIAEGRGADRGASNCPLCQFTGRGCSGCPIKQRTGKANCRRSPYVKWEDHMVLCRMTYTYDNPVRVLTLYEQEMALEMYGFLLSLLPDGVSV